MAGLLITYVALNLMDGHGQPALLYIVPFTLGKSFFLSSLGNSLSYELPNKPKWDTKTNSTYHTLYMH